MDSTVWLTLILTIGAVLEIGTGIGLLFAPSRFALLLLRSPLDRAGQAVARVAGGALLAVGIACWYAHWSPETVAGLGVARAFLVYNLVVSLTLVRNCPALASGGLPALCVAFIHGLLAVALLIALRRS